MRLYTGTEKLCFSRSCFFLKNGQSFPFAICVKPIANLYSPFQHFSIQCCFLPSLIVIFSDIGRSLTICQTWVPGFFAHLSMMSKIRFLAGLTLHKLHRRQLLGAVWVSAPTIKYLRGQVVPPKLMDIPIQTMCMNCITWSVIMPSHYILFKLAP